jgi:hypothetical protein
MSSPMYVEEQLLRKKAQEAFTILMNKISQGEVTPNYIASSPMAVYLTHLYNIEKIRKDLER